MINQASIQAVDACRIHQTLARPLYDTYCFSKIPPTIEYLLTNQGPIGLPADVLGDFPQRYDKVILLFVDAFGWAFFEKFCHQYPFLQRFMEEGVVSKLTSQFPSTTAAHVTTIHTGLPVNQSGVHEWFYYDPIVDDIIAPLLFSLSVDRERNGLSKLGFSGEGMFPTQTIFQRLQTQGVQSYAFQNYLYMPSPYSERMLNGAKIIQYRTIPETLINLPDAVIAAKGPAYFFCYFDPIDTIAHRYGPNSRHFEAEIHALMTNLENFFYKLLAGKVENTLLLVTADHGQIEVNPETTIYLNTDIPAIKSYIKTNRQGKPLVPAGSARDMFLYIKDECLEEGIALLARELEGFADIYSTAQLMQEGYFGSGQASAAFLERVGNAVILPQRNELVWWEVETVLKTFRGQHGGMTSEEMETIFLALPL